MRIGIFGGTFNPIHIAHLRIAEEVRVRFSLDQICFIPASIPPHKETNIARAENRLELVQQAISSNPYFTLSDIEIQRKGPSYTIDTIKVCKSNWKDRSQIFFIVGSDAFLEIDTWKSYRLLFDLISFIVMPRPQNNVIEQKNQPDYQSIKPLIDTMQRFIIQKVSSDYVYNNDGMFYHPKKQPIYICQVTALNISSTDIRNYCKQKKSVRYLVPDDVMRYIQNNKMYDS